MAGPSRPLILVLVGPKGSGKTTIGRMLEAELGVHFLHVELIAKQVLAASGGVIDESYARRAFEAILAAIDDRVRSHPVVAIETTGASADTEDFLARVQARHATKLVRIGARQATCEARMAARDQTHQVQVPAELVRTMHARSVALRLPWDLELDNDPPLSTSGVIQAFEPLLRADP